MSTTDFPDDLPFRATTDEACAWLARQTASPWTLARLLEHGVTPYVWLDYDPAFPDLFGDANGGYAAPIFFEADTARLAAGSDDVLITMTKDAYKIVATLPEPGWRRPLSDLRFQKKDLERLAGAVNNPPPPVQAAPARESQAGIPKAEVLAAFGQLARFDLARALDEAVGIFGDDGARVKASVRRSKKNAVWNPVTLALGLHEVHRVPLGALKRTFATRESLDAWRDDWEQSLRLLGA